MKGKHLIVDIRKCGRVPTQTELYDLLDALVHLIKMRKLISPYIVRGAQNNPGITGFVIIETSHISVHTFEKTKFIALDIYSCITFNHKIILKELYKVFDTKDIHYKVFAR